MLVVVVVVVLVRVVDALIVVDVLIPANDCLWVQHRFHTAQYNTLIAIQTCMFCTHTCIIYACIACITRCMVYTHNASPVGIIKNNSILLGTKLIVCLLACLLACVSVWLSFCLAFCLSLCLLLSLSFPSSCYSHIQVAIVDDMEQSDFFHWFQIIC